MPAPYPTRSSRSTICSSARARATSAKTPTLRGVVEYYNRGGNANPYMDLKMPRAPLGLSEAEIDALVAMLESLTGEGYADTAPTSFPQ